MYPNSPMPNSPFRLFPHAHKLPSDLMAKVLWEVPVYILDQLVAVPILTLPVKLFAVVPSPKFPKLLFPQLWRDPSVLIANE